MVGRAGRGSIGAAGRAGGAPRLGGSSAPTDAVIDRPASVVLLSSTCDRRQPDRAHSRRRRSAGPATAALPPGRRHVVDGDRPALCRLPAGRTRVGRVRAGHRAHPVLGRALLRDAADRTQPEIPRRQHDRAAARVVADDDGVRHVLRRSRPRRAADRVPRVVPVRRVPPANAAAGVPGVHGDRVVRADGAGALSQQAGNRRARRRDSAVGRAGGHPAMVCGDGWVRQPAARRDDLHQSRARRREERRRSGGPRQEHVPRQHEPRDPHADERRDRHDDPAARFRSHARAARVRRGDSRERRRPADHHQRHPRLLEDRRRQA